MRERRFSTKRIALLGLFLALALILGYIEFLIPFDFGIPGIKLGLGNAMILLALYLLGGREAFVLQLMRILLSGLLFGTMLSTLYSLSGGLLSFGVMVALKRTKRFQVISVSIAGGVSHNLGQLLVAGLIVENLHLFYYAPVLLFSGLATGALIGIIAGELIRRLKGQL